MKTITRFLLYALIFLSYSSCYRADEKLVDTECFIENKQLQTRTYYGAAYIYKIFSVFQERGGKYVLKIDWVRPSLYPTHIQLQYYKDGYWTSMIDCVSGDGVIGDALSFPNGDVRFRVRGIENVYNAGDDDNSLNVTPWSYEYTFHNSLENTTLEDGQVILETVFWYGRGMSEKPLIIYDAYVLVDYAKVATITGRLDKEHTSDQTITLLTGVKTGQILDVAVPYSSGYNYSSTGFSTRIGGKVIRARIDLDHN